MRYFKLVTSEKEGGFVIGEDEVIKLLKAVKSNNSAIFREGILLNPKMGVSVVPAKERNEMIQDQLKIGLAYDPPSPFAKLLSGKMKMLSDKSRTEVQEEVAKEIRNSGSGKEIKR